MSNNRTPSQNQTELALDEFAKQIQILREALAKYIQGKPTQKKNKYYEEVVVKGDRNQTFLRAWWNILAKVESFRKHMNDTAYPVIINAPLMAKYCYDIGQEIEANVRYKEVAYLSLTRCPTMEEFNKMPLKAEAAYIHVKNDSEDRLFCGVKHTKRFAELKVANMDEIYFDGDRSVGYLSNKKKNRLQKFEEQVKYSPQWANKDVYEVMKVAVKMLEWALDNASDVGFQFSATKLLPVINTFRKVLPFDAFLTFGRTIKADAIPKSCTMDDYVNNQNKSDFSLNGHLKVAYKMLQDEIKEYEYVYAIEVPKNGNGQLRLTDSVLGHFKKEDENKREASQALRSTLPLGTGC